MRAEIGEKEAQICELEMAESRLAKERDRAIGELEANFAERERGLKSQIAKQHQAWLDASRQTEEAKIKLRTAEEEIKQLKSQIKFLRSQPPPPSPTPDAADLLNQLKGRRKKSKADLADVEVLLDLFCDGCDR